MGDTANFLSEAYFLRLTKEYTPIRPDWNAQSGWNGELIPFRLEWNEVIPFRPDWRAHSIPAGMESLFHSGRNGMESFHSAWNGMSSPFHLDY